MSGTAVQMQPSVLILGASTRAAAQSAIRAGLRPICADLFADLDLRDCARVLDVDDYPHGLAAAAGWVSCRLDHSPTRFLPTDFAQYIAISAR